MKKYRHEAFGIGIAVADPRISESGKEIVDLEFCDCRRSILLCVLEPVDDYSGFNSAGGSSEYAH